MPSTLVKTYDQIYQKIQTVECWLNFTVLDPVCPRPLESEELPSAIRLKIENDYIKVTNPVRQTSLISVCENLLVIDNEGKWRLFTSQSESTLRIPSTQVKKHARTVHKSVFFL